MQFSKNGILDRFYILPVDVKQSVQEPLCFDGGQRSFVVKRGQIRKQCKSNILRSRSCKRFYICKVCALS